jgi:hypothetical protein
LKQVDPRDHSMVQDALQAVIQQKQSSIDIEYRVKLPDNTVKWFQARGKRLGHDEKNQKVVWLGRLLIFRNERKLKRRLCT